MERYRVEGEVRLFAPAKVNLFLSVHARREDGFHELSSLVVPLGFGDDLVVRLGTGDCDGLRCGQAGVPTGPENLILRAAAAFRLRAGGAPFFDFELEKRIPMGAGLGGGSSDAALALEGMNALLGGPLDAAELHEVAVELGSDCPFFLSRQAALMSGRGEILEPLSAAEAARLEGRRLLLFRPDFGVETAWAYGRLVARSPSSYEAAERAQERFASWRAGGALEALLSNSFEGPVGQKFLAINSLLAVLRAKGVPCLMSGSGSCCFALLGDNRGPSVDELRVMIKEAWGNGIFCVETFIASSVTRFAVNSLL